MTLTVTSPESRPIHYHFLPSCFVWGHCVFHFLFIYLASAYLTLAFMLSYYHIKLFMLCTICDHIILVTQAISSLLCTFTCSAVLEQ